MPELNSNTIYCHLVDREDSDNLVVPGTLTVAGVAVGGSGFAADGDLGGAEAARATVAEGIALRSEAGSQVLVVSDTGVLVSGGVADVTISAGDAVSITATGTGTLVGADVQVSATANCQVNGGTNLELQFDGTTRIELDTTGIGFFGTAPVAKPTGVAVTAEGIHAALVTLGLISA